LLALRPGGRLLTEWLLDPLFPWWLLWTHALGLLADLGRLLAHPLRLLNRLWFLVPADRRLRSDRLWLLWTWLLL
jgi:hypothetical protein